MAGNDQYLIPGLFPFFRLCGNPERLFQTITSFLARGDLCHLLINFANSLDPEQARQNVGPDLDANCFTL